MKYNKNKFYLKINSDSFLKNDVLTKDLTHKLKIVSKPRKNLFYLLLYYLSFKKLDYRTVCCAVIGRDFSQNLNRNGNIRRCKTNRKTD